GVTLDQLNEELIQHGLYYPIHIGQMTATLGGNVATNAGGMNAVKYGVTRHQVIGIEAVLPNGQVINSGGEFVKSSTGYDLTQLITGSEGTLAIVTRIILRIMPRPACREMLLVPFTSLEKAIDIVPQLLRLKTIPMGIEFIERDVIQAVEKQLEYELPNHNEEAFLMIIMEGDSSEEIIQYFAELENICRQNGAVEFYAPVDERAKRKLVEFREKMSPSLAKLGPWELVDAVVPRSEIANYIRKVKGIAKDFNTTIFAFGHAGDGNVHLHPTCIDQDKEQWRSMVPAIMQRLYEECTALGGTISGEHGIGSEKKRYLSLALSAETIALMKNIKAAFDPKNILNPGKIIDY
ncbi:MAG TPA: FAD-linked oxidase C-terminal domain-containing protein, partial [Dehalococcoidia bacterium]|nr:FAD-linked oxidase C-terminal domain-containing protein [Dehalococcoidia bacterium]